MKFKDKLKLGKPIEKDLNRQREDLLKKQQERHNVISSEILTVLKTNNVKYGELQPLIQTMMNKLNTEVNNVEVIQLIK